MDGLCFRKEILMHRFYPDPSRGGDGLEYLTKEDAHHALKVLRLHEGDRVEILTGDGRWIAGIDRIQGEAVALRKMDPLPSTEPSLKVTLFQGLPKADKMDQIVQKATELGVSRIVPVAMERSVTRIAPADSARKTERWQKIAREAGKQSGRCVIPVVEPPLTVSRLCAEAALPAFNIVPWEDARDGGLLGFHAGHPDAESIGVLIGPEGGISAGEMAELTGAGFLPVTLGKRILRTETAGPAVIAALMCLYGEMEQ